MDPIQGSWKPNEKPVNPTSSAGYEEPPPSYSTEPPPWTGKTICPPGVNQALVIPTTPTYTQDSPPPYSALPPNAAYVYSPYPTMANNGCQWAFTEQHQWASTEQHQWASTERHPSGTLVNPPRTSDYMSSSILSLFLCFPLGVVALIYSLKTRSALRRGDPDAAAESSHRALFLNKISRFGVLVIITLVSILVFYFLRTQLHNTDAGAG